MTDQNNDSQLLENGSILVNEELRGTTGLLNVHTDSNLLHDRILMSDSNITDGRPILIHNNGDSNHNFTERPVLLESCPRGEVRRGDLLLVKNGEYDKSHLVHLGFDSNIDIQLAQRTNLDNAICDNSMENMQAVYTNLQSAPKKRKLSQDVPLVKSEPGACLRAMYRVLHEKLYIFFVHKSMTLGGFQKYNNF